MKISFYEIEPWEKTYYQKTLSDHKLLFSHEKLSDDLTLQKNDAEILSTFLCSEITESVLKKFPNLKLIITRSTGYNHIDLQATQKRNIGVCNIPVYASISVAEHAFALMLGLARKIPQSYNRVAREHIFSSDSLRGMQLHGKTLGIIGMGHIGKEVAKIARGFSLKTLACDVQEDKTCAAELGFEYNTLERILQNSDIITLHLPLNKHTHHIINKDTIKKIKKGALLINTARGGLIETESLVWALENNILAGVGLDVLEYECWIKEPLGLLMHTPGHEEQLKITLQNYYLITHPRVLVTPHNAFNTHEALENLAQSTVETIKAWQTGKAINCVE